MNEWIGRTLGKVQIESLLARGGVAEIYLGTHTTLQRRVAVKILRNQYEDDPNLLERFQREAIVVSRLRHPNIVQILDFDSVESHPYIVMEYIAGPSLSRYLDAFHGKDRRMELPVISRLLTAVAGALDYAHEKGVIHRDVKPGNILLTSQTDKVIAGNTMPASFEPVLTDFGLVRFLNSSRQTSAGQIAGTPAYMSPEQARGETTDERTDIYSLGVVLYEMLSGRVPFEGETTMSVLLKHIHDPPEPIPDLAPALQDVLNYALEKNRADRFESPLDFASAFQAAIEQRYFTDTFIKEKPVPPQPQTKSVSEKKWRPALVIGIMTLLIGTFLWGWNFPFQSLPAASETPTIFSTTAVSIQVAFIQLGSTGILRFQDGKATADQAVFIAQAMPLPPPGNYYEVWLVEEEDRKSLGILSLDERGQGELTYTDADGVNLIGRYEKMEITLETDPDPAPSTHGPVVYASITPGEGGTHIRQLLSSSTTEEGGLIHGLALNIKKISQSAHEMKIKYANGEEAAARQLAESNMNILIGDQSLDYQDWDGDGQLMDPLDGYGLLLNGSNLGYIQAVFSEADYATNSPGVTQKMIVNGEDVKVCVQSLAQWAHQLRESLLAILTSPVGSDLTQLIQDSITFADQMLNGVDLDGNEVIDRVIGECGLLTTYESAYFMADMHLLPVAQNGTPITTPGENTPSATNTASKIITTPTKTNREPQNNPGFPQHTNTPIPPTNTPPQPTETPTQPPVESTATPLVDTPAPTEPSVTMAETPP